ncbi:MAG: GNAT family N-acetyltransferase, partial [Mesorhizobium sp.]
FLPAGNTADCGGGSGLPALIFEKTIG